MTLHGYGYCMNVYLDMVVAAAQTLAHIILDKLQRIPGGKGLRKTILWSLAVARTHLDQPVVHRL